MYSWLATSSCRSRSPRQRQQRRGSRCCSRTGRPAPSAVCLSGSKAGAPRRIGLAPADDDVLAVPVGDGHGVGGVGRDGGEPQAAGAGCGRLVAAVAAGGRAAVGGRGRRGAGPTRGGPGRGGDGHDGGGAHHRTAAERAGDDVADVLVVAGVRHLVEAGVTTAEAAGQGGTAAGMRAASDQRQQLAHCCSPLAVPLVSA